MMAKQTHEIKGLEKVQKALANGQQEIIDAAKKGLLRAALHLQARAQALAPVDTHNLENSIKANENVKQGADYLRAEVTANANTKNKETGQIESYAKKVHENMDYQGPNVGGSRSQAQGPDTIKKGSSIVESSDGTAGGKFIERPLKNKPEVYAKIVNAALEEVLDE
jgi:hypothetical protein